MIPVDMINGMYKILFAFKFRKAKVVAILISMITAPFYLA